MEAVRGLMSRYDSSMNEWKRFEFWDEKVNYTRNLIATDNKTFTLMLLCWNPGKFSPVHDHSGSECFMRIVDGVLQEHRYAWPSDKQKNENAPLQMTCKTPMPAGCVAFINDSIGLHRVANESTAGAVSLHCYMPPYECCRAWCQPERTCKAAECNVTFYSEHGQRVRH